MELIRSWMFVPGHRQKMIDKALGLNADAIMLDIEDGVAPNEKDAARQNIADSLGREKAPGTPARYVRINAIGHPRMDADLEAVVRPGLEGLGLPESRYGRRSAQSRRDSQRQGIEEQTWPTGSVKLLIAIESPRGLLNAPAIAAASSRIVGIIFGAEDFGRELGLPTVREGEARDLIYARSAIVVAAAAAHVQAVDGVWVDLNDSDGLARLRQTIAPARLLRHVVHSSVANRRHQHDFQSDGGGNRLLPKSSASLRRSQCARRRLHRLRRPTDRPADHRARAAHHRYGEIAGHD